MRKNKLFVFAVIAALIIFALFTWIIWYESFQQPKGISENWISALLMFGLLIILSANVYFFNKWQEINFLNQKLLEEVQVQAEKKQGLMANEQLYRSLVKSLDVGLCRWLPDTTLTYTNEKYRKLFGIEGDGLNKKWINFVPVSNRDEIARFYTDLVHNPRVVTYDHPVILEDGEKRYFKWIDSPVFDESGELLEYQSVGIDLTNRRQAEELLKEKEIQYRSLFEQAGDGLLVFDQEGKILEVNYKLCTLFGYSKAEFSQLYINKTLAADSDNISMGQQAFERLKNHGYSAFEGDFLTRSGEIIHGAVSASLIEMGEKKVYKALFRDITALRKAMRDLNHQATLLASINDAVITTDLKYNITSWNSAAEELYGYEKAEVIGRSISDFIPATYLGTTREAVIEEFNKQGYWKGEVIHKHKNGKEINILASVNIVRDEMGNPTNLLAINQDISALKSAQKALIDSELQFKTLTEMSPVGVFLNDKSGSCIYVNPTCAEIVGLSVEECMGFEWTRNLHPEDRDRVVAAWHKAMEASEPLEEEKRWVHEDGKIIYSLGNAVPLKGNNGDLQGYVGTLLDITRLKHAEMELRDRGDILEKLVKNRTFELQERISEVEKLNRQLKDTNQELESFSYSVSHDLRAPLRHINGFTQLLFKRQREYLDTKEGSYLDNILKASETMKQLIDDLLDFSRTSRAELDKGPVNLNQMVANLIGTFQKDFPDRKIDWKVTELPVVEGDASLIQIAFFNLIANAVKYTSEKKEAVIEIGTKRSFDKKNGENLRLEYCGDGPSAQNQTLSTDETCLYVRDNGVGFEQKYHEKIFGVFQRLHPAGKFEGTGIGLATVRRIIYRHGGHIWAKGEPGKGACFCFTLKVHQSPKAKLSKVLKKG